MSQPPPFNPNLPQAAGTRTLANSICSAGGRQSVDGAHAAAAGPAARRRPARRHPLAARAGNRTPRTEVLAAPPQDPDRARRLLRALVHRGRGHRRIARQRARRIHCGAGTANQPSYSELSARSEQLAGRRSTRGRPHRRDLQRVRHREHARVHGDETWETGLLTFSCAAFGSSGNYPRLFSRTAAADFNGRLGERAVGRAERLDRGHTAGRGDALPGRSNSECSWTVKAIDEAVERAALLLFRPPRR